MSRPHIEAEKKGRLLQMLLVEDIHTYYGESHVLQGVSLQVQAGETVALLGRNGAGKSTTIKSIIGFQPPRRGRILFCDVDVSHLPSYRTARLGAGLVPQGRSIFPTLTVRENITLAARSTHNGGWDIERVLETFPTLAKRLSHRGWQLSGGEQKILAIARALITNPRLLLLDEPSEGLAPLIVVEIARVIDSLREQGLSVLLVEQNLPFAARVADRVYVMSKGRVVYDGNLNELRNNEKILQRYLGV